MEGGAIRTNLLAQFVGWGTRIGAVALIVESDRYLLIDGRSQVNYKSVCWP